MIGFSAAAGIAFEQSLRFILKFGMVGQQQCRVRCMNYHFT